MQTHSFLSVDTLSSFARKLLLILAPLVVGNFSLVGNALAEAPTSTINATKPSLLICARVPVVDVDLVYVKRLQKAGFLVDYIESWPELTWERISKFDVLFVFETGEDRSLGGGPNPTELVALLDRYMEAGGGVYINVNDLSYYAPGQYAMMVKNLAPFGVKVPAERLVTAAGDRALNPRLRNEFIYTTNVLPSPVSEGVKGIWIPEGRLAGHLRPDNGTFELDSNWQPVVKGPKGSTTEAFDLVKGGASDSLREKNVYFRAPVVEPDLYAIRPYKKGRMAIFYLNPAYHIGQGTKWLLDGVLIDKGLNGKPSDFGKLFENTLRWLAQPAIEIGQLGGAEVDPNRMIPVQLRPGARDRVAEPGKIRQKISSELKEFSQALPVFKGFVGARTTLSGGTSTVSDYAQAAREQGLGFVIILEDGAQMTQEKVEALKSACTAASSEDLLVIPGFRFSTNLGVSFFIYGKNPVLPPADVQSKLVPGGIQLQGEAPEGKWEASDKILHYIFMNWIKNETPGLLHMNAGFYDFKNSTDTKTFFKPEYARASAMGVKFYKQGKLVEDLTADYLRVNAGTLPVTPMSVNLVDSVQEMTASLERGDALTYGQAPRASELLQTALTWVGANNAPQVFISNGPIVENWADMLRVWVYGQEDFVNEASYYPGELRVRSDVGLKEVAIYDGEKLFRRFLPGGAKEWKEKLFISGEMEQTLSVLATDVNGGQALTMPRRSYKEGGQTSIVFCTDHVNDCYAANVKHARGVFWPTLFLSALIPDAGGIGDGGPVPLVNLWGSIPGAYFNCVMADGTQEGGMPYQYPVLSNSDARVYRGTSVASGILNLNYAGPWNAFGPVTPRQMYDASATCTAWSQYSTGIDPHGWGPPYAPGGTMSTLFEEPLTFKRDGTVKELSIGGGNTTGMKNRGTLLSGVGDKILDTFDLTPDSVPRNTTIKLPVGGWFAVVSADGANAMLTFNRGVPMRLFATEQMHTVLVDVPAEGMSVKKGQQINVELLTIHWPLNIPIATGAEMLRVVNYLASLEKMPLTAGKIVSSSAGLLDVMAANYQVELALPQPPQSGPAQVTDTSVPMRVSGLNPRWSAGLLQIKGHNGGNYYSDGSNRFRPLGMDEKGRVYAPLYTAKAPETHVRVGHPVVADDRGKDLFIQTTAMTDPKPGVEPAWHVSVNNPTDQPITTVLKNNMQLPGMKFTEQAVTLKPGEYKILEHTVTEAPRAASLIVPGETAVAQASAPRAPKCCPERRPANADAAVR
jgi:hypothetical protein